MRKSNLELLRIVAMLMIIGLYYWAYNCAGDFYQINESVNNIFYIVTESFFICGVNLFVLISGWLFGFKTVNFCKKNC